MLGLLRSKKLGLSVLLTLLCSTSYAVNFNCPDPALVKSTDFTSPSIWVAPGLAHTKRDNFGVGLGGRFVRELLGVEKIDGGKVKGWMCVYRSEGGMSLKTYEKTIRHIVKTTDFLRHRTDDMNRQFERIGKYLDKYPKDADLGFLVYLKDGK